MQLSTNVKVKMIKVTFEKRRKVYRNMIQLFRDLETDFINMCAAYCLFVHIRKKM